MSDDNPAHVIKLGPLFPKPISAFLSVVMVGTWWIIPLFSSALPSRKLIAFLAGCITLALFYIPRLGVVEVDPSARTIRYREGLTASLFHFWRGPDTRQISLPPESTVTVGEWLGKNSFPTLGIKRVAADGETSVLLEQRFAFDGPAALLMAAALREVRDVKVCLVRLNDRFESVEWQPQHPSTGKQKR